MLFNHVLFHSELYETDGDEEDEKRREFRVYRKRMFWLHFCRTNYAYDLDACVDWLYTVSELCKKKY